VILLSLYCSSITLFACSNPLTINQVPFDELLSSAVENGFESLGVHHS
jgi:hypothetical protein